ncbi:MAG: citrate synthase family protein [Acidobacteria bacterium]|nr:citrate synthase family protein [Acidobacteriota bacterium]
MESTYYLGAKEAAEALGVSMATLYAYTSRGQLRSEPVPQRPRERRYLRADVARLGERKEARRDPAKAAARGLHWGSAVLESGITLIHEGRLYYRGKDAVEFAERATLEQAAALLWEGDFDFRDAVTVGRLAGNEAITRFQMALPAAGALDEASYDLRPAGVRRTGARILRLLTAVAAGREGKGPIHKSLAEAWGAEGEAIRTALVLCADHELNASAFTARCAASAGATPYDVVSAALATLKGRRHGGETERVAALFDEAGSARAALGRRLRMGERLPGFGHPLYPAGDPRAGLLLRLAEQRGSRREWKLARGLMSAAAELVEEKPNLDFGLVAMARAYGLPAEAPIVLFALGRTVGWIAHAMEQYATGELIRPRANYTGPAPETSLPERKV